MRIGNAERSVVVALAHAVVLSEKEKGLFVFSVMAAQILKISVKAGKKWSQEKLVSRLEQGADILKAVYR